MSQIQYCSCGSIYDITNNISEFIDVQGNDKEKNKPYFFLRE